MNTYRLYRLLATLSLLAAVVGASAVSEVSAATPSKMDITLVNHIQAGLPEQDVFLETGGASSGQVLRVEGDAAKDPANLSQMVFSSASAVPHDPFKVG